MRRSDKFFVELVVRISAQKLMRSFRKSGSAEDGPPPRKPVAGCENAAASEGAAGGTSGGGEGRALFGGGLDFALEGPATSTRPLAVRVDLAFPDMC